MRILFIIDHLGSGGGQRQIITLALGLKQRGFHVEFFVYYEQNHFQAQLEAAEIQIHRSSKQSRFSLKVFFDLRQIMNRVKADVVISFLETPNFYNIAISQSLRPSPIIIVSEGSADPRDGISFRQKVIRNAYRWADYVVINSHHQRENFLNKHPWVKNKVTTIYNGLDTHIFYPSQEELPHDPLRLLAIGRIYDVKNASCLVQALVILQEEYQIHPIVNWVGRVGDDAYFNAINDDIKQNLLTKQWNWLFERHDIVDLLQQHHALVHPSYREGLPNVVCEALACGCPVIVSNILDHPLLVQDGISGFLFDWQSPADLASAIYKIYNLSLSERLHMGQSGRTYAKANLSLQQYISNFESLIQKL
jgi:glycosyltransferase involved in cell wall biosynthesis